MRKPKVYLAETGIALDATFAHHATNCEQCMRYDADKPSTLALQCLEGSVLWKRENSTPIKREKADQSATVVSKSEAKAAMKYK